MVLGGPEARERLLPNKVLGGLAVGLPRKEVVDPLAKVSVLRQPHFRGQKTSRDGRKWQDPRVLAIELQVAKGSVRLQGH